MSKATNQPSPEVRERAVRLVLHGGGQHGCHCRAIVSSAAIIGCSVHTFNGWRKAEVDNSEFAGVPSDATPKMMSLAAGEPRAGPDQ